MAGADQKMRNHPKTPSGMMGVGWTSKSARSSGHSSSFMRTDMLRNMVMKEAERRGIKVVVASRDIETGADLLADKPFGNDLIEAKKGSIDAYHSGFPCTTYTRLRWNPKEGYPGPVRSKSKPYGLDDLNAKRRKEVDDGTLMMARSVFMGKAIMDFDWDSAFPSVVTLENPPPSDHPEHISAWEMAELAGFVQDYKLKVANFNTCRFQSDRKLGTKNFKPQRFAGNLPGLESLSKTCQCGKHKHEQIVGKEKSAASAGYPVDLAVEYARLLLDHFERVLKMEFTEGKLEAAAGNLNRLRNLKSQSMYQPKEHVTEKGNRNPSEPPLKRLKVREKHKEPKEPEGRAEADRSPLKRKQQPPKGKSIEERLQEGERGEGVEEQQLKTTTAKAKPAAKVVENEPKAVATEEGPEDQSQPGINLAWKGGEGPYGSNKLARGKKQLEGLKVETALGGMRDPHKAVSKLPTVQNLGLKVQAAWDTPQKALEGLGVGPDLRHSSLHLRPVHCEGVEGSAAETFRSKRKPEGHDLREGRIHNAGGRATLRSLAKAVRRPRQPRHRLVEGGNSTRYWEANSSLRNLSKMRTGAAGATVLPGVRRSGMGRRAAELQEPGREQGGRQNRT